MEDSHPIVLPEDPKEAHKVFNTLPVKSQLETVLQARGKERLHFLFLSEHPEQLVQLLPEMEVFLTVKEIGEKDSLHLISLTTPEQFQYLLDLDFWKRDQLDPEKVLHWMEILLESGEKKVIQFIHSSDPEFIALLLKKFLHVTTLEGEHVEVMDRLSLFTLDQFYFVDFRGKRTREVFEPFLRILYRIDGEGYRRLMESIMCEIESELEETGYRLRNGRLNDYGFPDFEEALEIYRFVNPDSLRREERPPQAIGPREGKIGSSTFYLTFQNEGPFLSYILSGTDDPDEEDRVKQELASLCNKAIVAEAIDLSNISAMERVVKKVYHTLNLGLQYLSREEETKALETLRSLSIQKIFQCGVSTTLLLRRKAESILKGPWFSNDQENLVFLDPPHLERFEGVLKKRPSLYRNGKFEDFKNLQDFKEIESFLELIEVVVSTLGQKFNVYPLRLKDLNLSGCHPERWQEITLSTIFLTSIANQILKGRFQFEAIEKICLKDLFLRVFERDGEGKGVVRMEIKKGLREWLESIEGDENKRQHLKAFSDFCLDLFEEQYGSISQGEEVDPRYVKGLLIRS
ncbi:MAG: DUF6178 family protein [Thermodesulfobacteriota bacterium]